MHLLGEGTSRRSSCRQAGASGMNSQSAGVLAVAVAVVAARTGVGTGTEAGVLAGTGSGTVVGVPVRTSVGKSVGVAGSSSRGLVWIQQCSFIWSSMPHVTIIGGYAFGWGS